MSTSAKSVSRELARLENSNSGDIDQYTTEVCLTRTMGDVVFARERATNARQFFIANLIFNAVAEKDMGLIEIIATRIDGTVPVSSERESFANIMGDAIDDVLEMEDVERTLVYPDDPVIVALAKVVFQLAVCPAKSDYNKKRERQKAVEMVYARTAGRRNEPVRLALEEKFVEPEWLANLDVVE